MGTANQSNPQTMTSIQLDVKPDSPDDADEHGEEHIVRTVELTKAFGEFTALDRCSLSIPNGQVFGLLGPNGAGKTTLLRLLMGFMKPTSGHAFINSLDCHRQRTQVHRLVAYLPGDARLPRMMSGREALKFFCGLRPDADSARALQIADRLDLNLSRWVAFMSTGMRQKLALAIVLSIECPLLILDEPTANLDPTVRSEVIEMVAEAKSRGRTVILSSHVLSEIEEVCQRVGIVRGGRLVCDRSMHDLKAKHRIRGTQLAPGQPTVPPAEFTDAIEIRQLGNELVIDTSVELSKLLSWLEKISLGDLRIEPIGLRTVYEQFHGRNADVDSL